MKIEGVVTAMISEYPFKISGLMRESKNVPLNYLINNKQIMYPPWLATTQHLSTRFSLQQLAATIDAACAVT